MELPSTFMYNSETEDRSYGEACETKEAYEHAGDVIRYTKRTVREDPANLGDRVISGRKEYPLGEIIEQYLIFFS